MEISLFLYRKKDGRKIAYYKYLNVLIYIGNKMNVPYFKNYSPEAGDGYNVYRGAPYQEGYGIGSF